MHAVDGSPSCRLLPTGRNEGDRCPFMALSRPSARQIGNDRPPPHRSIWMLAFPGTAHNSAESWNRNRIDWLVLPTNRFSEIADLLDQIDAEVVSTTAGGA